MTNLYFNDFHSSILCLILFMELPAKHSYSIYLLLPCIHLFEKMVFKQIFISLVSVHIYVCDLTAYVHVFVLFHV
jgi:hypothetical protein